MSETSKSGNLVLTRKGGRGKDGEGQRIRVTVGDEIIWITVGQIKGDKARIIVNASRTIPVVREECLPESERFGAVGAEPEPKLEPVSDIEPDELRRTG